MKLTMLLIMLFEIIVYYFYNAQAYFCSNGPIDARWGSELTTAVNEYCFHHNTFLTLYKRVLDHCLFVK
ncbi:hypothetical protein K0M31_002365 [Melipona bicolor]|uniref:Uncharacterized protein n=1 Tax=Melipona bicolor TaxID=60889 RepID=A0AA40KYS8_9HYME|nr:hypothetical protein K0M31_002365 [Melipona bicolor]